MNLAMIGAIIYAVPLAFDGKKKTLIDFDSFILPVVVIVVFGLVLWETIVIVDFLIKDVRGQIILDKQKLTIIKGKKQEILDYKDLIKIELAGPRDGSRSLTARWTYAKLTFKGKILFLTSLTVNNDDIKKEFGLLSSKTLSRDRKYFELIK